MMKRYFLPIALLIFLLLSLSACGESHSPNRSLSFELLDNGTYAVVGIGTYNADDLIIPAEYNNAPVTQIASNAFRDVWYIQSVTLPPSVTVIGNNAFDGCQKLKKIYVADLALWCQASFHSALTKNDFSLYLNGELVETLVIPSEVETIADSAFGKRLCRLPKS